MLRRTRPPGRHVPTAGQSSTDTPASKRIAASLRPLPTACRLTRLAPYGRPFRMLGSEATGEAADEAQVIEALARLGLLYGADTPRFTRLTGGVSSDIWRVDLARGPVCVKRALAKLRVKQDWFAPVERNAYEAAWMRRAAAVVPEAVPELLAQDEAAGVLVMAYLDPADHRLWKADLRAGQADPDVARAVGDRLVPHSRRDRRRPQDRRRSFRPTRSSTTSGSSRIWSPPRRRIRTGPTRCSALARRTATHQTRPGPWRRQPEEHPDRTATARFSSTRNAPGTAIRRSISPSASTTCCSSVSGRRRRHRISSRCFDALRRGLSRRRRLGAARRDRGAHGAAAARAVPRPGRRQVAGRVRDRGRRTAIGSAGSARALLAHPVERLAGVRDAWARELAL